MTHSQERTNAFRKEVKYAGLDGRYMFAAIVFENLGVGYQALQLAMQLLSYLGRRLTDISGESRETSLYVFQICSISVQRFKAVLLHDSLPDRNNCTDY